MKISKTEGNTDWIAKKSNFFQNLEKSTVTVNVRINLCYFYWIEFWENLTNDELAFEFYLNLWKLEWDSDEHPKYAESKSLLQFTWLMVFVVIELFWGGKCESSNKTQHACRRRRFFIIILREKINAEETKCLVNAFFSQLTFFNSFTPFCFNHLLSFFIQLNFLMI